MRRLPLMPINAVHHGLQRGNLFQHELRRAQLRKTTACHPAEDFARFIIMFQLMFKPLLISKRGC